ncbi:hypothetical protein BVI061214_00022 [Thermus aquaticus]|uniref:Uncharacterized protein n=1 Tax=Thermus aquaticus TaxID=271 RepID=A0A0N0BMM2_THEAQ|nr:hypothetical protein BVI061214_00022 [Thermus aquaticus]
MEVRENPYAAMEGGRKHELMRALLKDVDLRVGARFGHGGSLGGFPLADRPEGGAGSVGQAMGKGMARRNSAG